MLFQDASTYNYLSNGFLPVSGWDDAADLQDSMVSGIDQFLLDFFPTTLPATSLGAILVIIKD